MEPTQAEVSPRVRYHVYTTCKSVWKNTMDQWFIHFDGSWESLCLGPDQPDMKPGDKIHITIERTT